MIRQEPELESLVKMTIQPPRVSMFNGAFVDEYVALSSTADSKDGKKPSMLLIDEPHSYPSKALYQIMSDGLAGRREPLEIFMSTAGYNMQGFFYLDVYQYAKKVKAGIIEDETFYSVMFEPNEEDLLRDDFWKDPEVWKVSNPNLGISPTLSYMESKVKLAENSEESKVAFLTKHLNVWCDKASVWIPHKVWTQNQFPIDIESLKGKLCYAGLDLATIWDLAAFILIFPDDSQGFRRYDILCRFFVPKDNLLKRVQKDKVPYLDFLRDGLITATPGNEIDYSYIEKQILQDCNDFNVKMIAYDRYNSNHLIQKLTEAECSEMIKFSQNMTWFNAPIREIELLAHQGRLNHQNNKVLNWHCSNVVLMKDSNDNMKFDKNKSIEKIDGMVSLTMAMGVCLVDLKEKVEENIYEQRGLIDL